MTKDQREIQRKLRILRYAEETGHVARTCRYFGIGRSSFYRWRQTYADRGEEGLINAPPIPKWHANRTPPEREEKVRRFQYTAIDFVDHIIEKFPFRIREIRTDNGHEFQAKFHWHVEDLGIRHAYIKRGTPQLNGKVERSHRSDGQEFYQLLSDKGDVDLEAKLDEWEKFYNFHRPHGAHNGNTPYEALREKLVSTK